MAEIQKLGSIKRFGTRYGKTLKERLAKIESEQKKKHKCPYCHYQKVRQVNIGILYCSKCGTKFSGKAYSLGKKFLQAPTTNESMEKGIAVEEAEGEQEG